MFSTLDLRASSVSIQHVIGCSREVEQERGIQGSKVITCWSHKSKKEVGGVDFFLPFGSRVDVYVDTAGRIDLDKIPDSWKKNHLTKSKELRFVTFMKIPFRFHCCSECIIPGRIASSPGSGQQVEHDAPAPRGCQATSSQDEICICTL